MGANATEVHTWWLTRYQNLICYYCSSKLHTSLLIFVMKKWHFLSFPPIYGLALFSISSYAMFIISFIGMWGHLGVPEKISVPHKLLIKISQKTSSSLSLYMVLNCNALTIEFSHLDSWNDSSYSVLIFLHFNKCGRSGCLHRGWRRRQLHGEKPYGGIRKVGTRDKNGKTPVYAN